MTRLEKVIKIARYFRTKSLINKLLVSKREQDLEKEVKELKEELIEWNGLVLGGNLYSFDRVRCGLRIQELKS